MPVEAKSKSKKITGTRKTKSSLNGNLSGLISNAPKSPLPRQVSPMLTTLVDKPFDDKGWLFEVKWDGYRAMAVLNGKSVSLQSRNDKSFKDKFYPVHEALVKWNLRAVLDGEIVVIN